MKEGFLSLRAIDKAGLDFVGKNGVLAIGNDWTRLVPKGNLYACETFKMSTNIPIRFVDDPPSEDVAAKALIAPGDSHPSEIGANSFHASYSYAQERLLKATAHKVGGTLAGKLGTHKG